MFSWLILWVGESKKKIYIFFLLELASNYGYCKVNISSLLELYKKNNKDKKFLK